MSVTIKWTQNAAGREPGDVETVEETPFIEAIISMGRAVVVDDEEKPKPILGVVYPQEPVEAAPVVEAVEPEAETDAVHS